MADAVAASVDLGVGLASTDDGMGSEFHEDAAGVLEDGIEGVADSLSTLVVEAGGASVTANGGMVGEAEVSGNLGGGPPAEEVGFDVLALWVLANAALTGVSLGVGRWIVGVVLRPTPATGGDRASRGVGLEEGLGGLEGLGCHVVV